MTETFVGYSPSKFYYTDILPHPELDYWELDFYKKNLPHDLSTLVDLGCGNGDFLYHAKIRYPFACGIDINQYAIEVCKQKGLFANVQDATETNFKNNSFQIVRAQNILEHIQYPSELIKEAKRILTRDGYFIIHIPTQFSLFYPVTNFWDDYTHIRPFSKRGITRLLYDFGFKVQFIKGYTLGRNRLETFLGKIIEKVIPFNWFVIAVLRG